MLIKDTDGIANSVDPDQTAPKSLIWVCIKEQSDLGLHCLHKPISPKT